MPVTNFYRGEILEADQLPIRRCAYTPCFRREAGSWGAHVRGLNRLHQFDKVELVKWTDAESSTHELEQLRADVETLLQKLELPYRILRLCGGDMSFASALTFDFEVFSAAQQRWLEVSSVSNFETFQSNRMKARYKTSAGKKELVLLLSTNSDAIANGIGNLAKSKTVINSLS